MRRVVDARHASRAERPLEPILFRKERARCELGLRGAVGGRHDPDRITREGSDVLASLPRAEELHGRTARRFSDADAADHPRDLFDASVVAELADAARRTAALRLLLAD